MPESTPRSRRSETRVNSTSTPTAEADENPAPLPSGEDEVLHRKVRAGQRLYSVPSQDALLQLATVDASVSAIEKRVAEINTLSQREEEPAGPLRTELANLEARAHKIECQGVDNIYTGDLSSGKAEAKEMKKSLLIRLEKLFQLIDATFAQLDPKNIGGTEVHVQETQGPAESNL